MSSMYGNFKSQAELDAAYDVENSVADFMVYANQYIEGSAQVRIDLQNDVDVAYGPTVDEYVDIFPAAKANAPVLVFLHGGYWKSLSAKEFSFVARGLVASGITVVVGNYSICPTVTMDEIVRQARAMVAWVYKNISCYNGDPNKLFVCGHSAGGHLAAMCILTDWPRAYGLPSDLIAGGVLISGLFDLEPLQYSFLQSDLRLSKAQIQRNSPQYLVSRVSSHFLISYGDNEPLEFSRQSDDFFRACKAEGNQVSLLTQSGCNHFMAIMGFMDGKSSFCESICKFMGHRADSSHTYINASEHRYGVSLYSSRRSRIWLK